MGSKFSSKKRTEQIAQRLETQLEKALRIDGEDESKFEADSGELMQTISPAAAKQETLKRLIDSIIAVINNL